MYHDRIALTIKDILEKEFKIDARGYRLQEVDKFLDITRLEVGLHNFTVVVEYNNETAIDSKDLYYGNSEGEIR